MQRCYLLCHSASFSVMSLSSDESSRLLLAFAVLFLLLLLLSLLPWRLRAGRGLRIQLSSASRLKSELMFVERREAGLIFFLSIEFFGEITTCREVTTYKIASKISLSSFSSFC